MAKQKRKLDKYDEIFESVLSGTNFEPHPNSDDENKSATTKMDIKKRKKNLCKPNLKSSKRVKKRKETSKNRMLKLNSFYSNNSFGIWIQCTDCNKWRQVMEYEEAYEVPKNWCCSMSISGTSSCAEPENIEEADFSPVNFVPGTIVWAKYSGYPWWPGMIEDDPDTEEYYWIGKNGKCFYNVTFLDDKVTRAWVSDAFVCSYLDPPKTYKFLTARHSNYAPLIAAAEINARNAMNMSIRERLQKFSFVHRFKGKWGSALSSDDSDEDKTEENLTEILLKEMDDIESIKSTDSDCRSVNSFDLKKNETDNKFGCCEISPEDNSVSNTEKKNIQTNRNEWPVETQSKKKNKSMTEDGIAHLKSNDEKVDTLNKLIDEAIIHLDEVISCTTENEGSSKICIFDKGKKVKSTLSKLTKEETSRINDDVSTSLEKVHKDNLRKDNSKNKKTNTVKKTSKKKNERDDRIKKFKEKTGNAKENEDRKKLSLLKKHFQDINHIKKESPKAKILNISSSKFKPPMKNNKNNTFENKVSNESMNNKEIIFNVSVHNSNSIIKEKKTEEIEISEKNLEENGKNIRKNTKNKNKNSTNDSGMTFSETLEENKKENNQQEKGNKNNNLKDLATSEVQGLKVKSYNKRNKSTVSIMKPKLNIKNMKINLATGDLPVSVLENSELVKTSKYPTKQNISKKQTQGNFKAEIQDEAEEMKHKQENKIINGADHDDIMQKISCNENSNNDKFALSYEYSVELKGFENSLELNIQKSDEENSDPFEAE